MFELKPISSESIPEALVKSERYRFLNDPWLAESICLDILEIEPGHQKALAMLLLSRTDQFGQGTSPRTAKEICDLLTDPYEKAYYRGLIAERDAYARLRRGSPFAGYDAYELLREAMEWYEKAQPLRPKGNDDSILRWNTCARRIMRESSIQPRPAEKREVLLDD